MKKLSLTNIMLSFSIMMVSMSANAQFAGGLGTESDPFLIETADQLNAIRNNMDGKHFKLNNDIDLTSFLNINSPEKGWDPIGDTPTTGITGSFDGNGYVISGFYINRPTVTDVALFGSVKTSGLFSVRRLGLIVAEGKEVKGLNNVAGIIGEIPYTGQTIKISECFVIGNITAVGDGKSSGAAGSIVAMTSATGRIELLNCYALGKVYGFAKAGGLVGQGYRGIKIETSYSACEVEAGSSKIESKAGGLIGECGFPNGSPIRHDIIASIALNPSVKAPNSPTALVGRLVGYEKPDNSGIYNYEYNYAWKDMAVNNVFVIGGLDSDKNGLSQSSESVVKEDVYFGDDYLYWDPAVWSMGNVNYQLPILKALNADKQPKVMLAHLPQSPVSAIQLLVENEVSVYPTSTTGRISLMNKADGIKVSIFNLTGQVVMESFNSEIDLGSLNAGVYLVNIQGKMTKVIRE